MAANIYLEIVTPEKIVVSEKIQTVVAPGIDGEFGVLEGHTPFMSALSIGSLRYKDEQDTDRCVFINGGFAEVLPNKVTVLTESADRRCEIDLGRARSAMERAQSHLDSDEEAEDFERAKAAMARAQARLSLAETRKASNMQ